MKINFVFLVPFAATAEASLLSVSTKAATAGNLMNAVGLRNVTTMEALVQQLAHESVSEPGWKFDADIKAALHAIRDMFVKSIQTALKDEHKLDQESFNCFTQDCFGNCTSEYKKDADRCNQIGVKCDGLAKEHGCCREQVYDSYMKMAEACGELHCFQIEDPKCNPEDCLCPELSYCHRKSEYGESCEARVGHCNGEFGGWLQGQLQRYERGHDRWEELHGKCSTLYHAFLTADMECDATQKSFEKCACEKNGCDHTNCGLDFAQCTEQCWNRYYELVDETQCLEKDRKIDWSATKKIECYIDVLLHNYTKKELIGKCGTEHCINVARESDFKHCATICPEIDHDGQWPQVLSAGPGNVKVDGHERREAVENSEYLLGDGEYKCDTNGADKVFTKHRGGDTKYVLQQHLTWICEKQVLNGRTVKGANGTNCSEALAAREGDWEARCTEHLDIDYQVPECMQPDCERVPICDAAFHTKHYSRFDDISKIDTISDCFGSCFPDAVLQSSGYVAADDRLDCGAGGLCHCAGPAPPPAQAYVLAQSLARNDPYTPPADPYAAPTSRINIPEHSHAWAYNRCECTQCQEGSPEYTRSSVNYRCGDGAHTIRTGSAYGAPATPASGAPASPAYGAPGKMASKQSLHGTKCDEEGAASETPPSLSGGCQRCTCAKGVWQCACSMRHRKDINDLTEEEFKKFAMAVNKLKADGTWFNITMAHIRSGEQIRTHSAGLTQLHSKGRRSYPSPPPGYGAPAPPAYGAPAPPSYGPAPPPSQDGYAEEEAYTVEEEGYEERRNSHNSVIFLPWHRKFLVEVENRLQMALNDCSVTLPYWNWALELTNFENAEIFGADRLGSLNTRLGHVSDVDQLCVKDGAFGAKTEGSKFGHGSNELGNNLNGGQGSDCIMRAGRKPTNENYASIMTWLLEPTGMSKASRDFESMSLFLERDLHNSFHTAIGGRNGHMGGMASAYDPIFFLHHGFVDYLWKQWQDTHHDSSERFHRRGDLMPRLLWDGERSTFPAADVSMSMDILDDDASTAEHEKACVYYHERQEYHPCAGQWDKIRSCLAKVVKDKRLHEVPRIRELTSVGDVCSPLNPVQADLDRIWLETMSEMGMLEKEEVGKILKWESTLNGQIASSVLTLEEAEADQCDKALCFSASKLLAICEE